MKPHATVRATPRGIELRCEAAGLLEERPLPPEEVARLADWSARYRQIALRRQRVPLLDLGEEIFRWLDGASRFLERIVDLAPVPLVIEFGAAKQDASAAARALRDAPWEVLGDPDLLRRAVLERTVSSVRRSRGRRSTSSYSAKMTPLTHI